MISATGFNVDCYFLQHLIIIVLSSFLSVFIVVSGLGLHFLSSTSLLVHCDRLMSLWKPVRKWKWTGQRRQAVRARSIQAVSFFDSLLIVKFVGFFAVHVCACILIIARRISELTLKRTF